MFANLFALRSSSPMVDPVLCMQINTPGLVWWCGWLGPTKWQIRRGGSRCLWSERDRIFKKEVDWCWYGCFQKWWYPKMDGLYIMEIPIKMDDLGGKTHYFWKHPYQLIANLKKNDSSIRNAKNLPIGREHSWGTMTSYKSTTHDKQTSGAGRFYSTIVLFFFCWSSILMVHLSSQESVTISKRILQETAWNNCSSASLTPGGLHDPIATWTTKPFELGVDQDLPVWFAGKGLTERSGYHKKSI